MTMDYGSVPARWSRAIGDTCGVDVTSTLFLLFLSFSRGFTNEATISRGRTAAPVPPAKSLGGDVGYGAGGVDDGWSPDGGSRRGEPGRSGVGYRGAGFAAASIPDRGRSVGRGGGGIPACHRPQGCTFGSPDWISAVLGRRRHADAGCRDGRAAVGPRGARDVRAGGDPSRHSRRFGVRRCRGTAREGGRAEVQPDTARYAADRRGHSTAGLPGAERDVASRGAA